MATVYSRCTFIGVHCPPCVLSLTTDTGLSYIHIELLYSILYIYIYIYHSFSCHTHKAGNSTSSYPLHVGVMQRQINEESHAKEINTSLVPCSILLGPVHDLEHTNKNYTKFTVIYKVLCKAAVCLKTEIFCCTILIIIK